MVPGSLAVRVVGAVNGVAPGSQSYTSPGTYSWSVPKYNTLTVEMWGAGGEGTSIGGSTGNDFPGANGGNTTFKGMVAGGGQGGLGNTSGGAGGTATGGTTNTVGGTGANGSDYSRTAGGSPDPAIGGKGGDSPNGGAGGAQISRTANGGVGGNDGASPGGGGGGSVYKFNNGINDIGKGGKGGGGGGYVKRTYTIGAAGAPVPGTAETAVVGARVATTGQNGGLGGNGRIVFTWS